MSLQDEWSKYGVKGQCDPHTILIYWEPREKVIDWTTKVVNHFVSNEDLLEQILCGRPSLGYFGFLNLRT